MACSAAVTCRCICMSCHKLQTYLRWSVSLSYVSHSLECLSILRLSLAGVSLYLTSLTRWSVSLSYVSHLLECLSILRLSLAGVSLYLTSLTRWSVSLSYVSHSLECLSILRLSLAGVSLYLTSLTCWSVSLSYVSHSLECLSILRLSLFYKSIVFEQCASIIICAHPYSGSSHCVTGSWDAWETHLLLSSSTSRWPLSPRKYLLPGCLAFPRMTHLLDHTLSPCMPYTR